MRPNVTRRNTWAQLGIGACALLLPPLALGAVFYSMLAAPDEGATRPAGAQAETQAALPDTPGLIARPARAELVAGQLPAGRSAEDVARMRDQVQGGPGQVTSGQVTSGQIAVPPAAAINPRTAGGAPAVDGPPAPVAPKRAIRRHTHRQPQQEEYPLRNWLQQIGVLPRNSNTGGS